MSATHEGQPESIRLLDLDADVLPTGPAVRIGGKEHHFKTDDELSIADRENLMLFSLRLREIRETPPEDDMLLPTEVDARLVDMQRRVLRIALPTVAPALLDGLDGMKVHRAVTAFTSGISLMSWMHWTTRQWILSSLMPTRLATAGAQTSETTGASSDDSANTTPTSKDDSTEATEPVTGDALTG